MLYCEDCQYYSRPIHKGDIHCGVNPSGDANSCFDYDPKLYYNGWTKEECVEKCLTLLEWRQRLNTAWQTLMDNVEVLVVTYEHSSLMAAADFLSDKETESYSAYVKIRNTLPTEESIALSELFISLPW